MFWWKRSTPASVPATQDLDPERMLRRRLEADERLIRSEQNTRGEESALLAARGFDPDLVIPGGEHGAAMTLLDLYRRLRQQTIFEAACRLPSEAVARLVLLCDLPPDLREACYLGFLQKSNEETKHAESVFGAVYLRLGGRPAKAVPEDCIDDVSGGLLVAAEDPAENTRRFLDRSAIVAGTESASLFDGLPIWSARAKSWDDPLGRWLHARIETVVRPEEARHVLLTRMIFHRAVRPLGADAVARFVRHARFGVARTTRREFDEAEFMRAMGAAIPSFEDALGLAPAHRAA